MLHEQRAYISHPLIWESYDKAFSVFGFKAFYTVLAVHVDTFLVITLKDYIWLPVILEYIYYA
jgi:hypothetical protein